MRPLDIAIQTAINAHRRQPARQPAPARPAPVQPAQQPLPFSTAQRIADFYAGKPLSISYDNGVMGQGISGSAVAGSSAIKLSPEALQSLQYLFKNYGTDQGAYKGVPGLATLIHEALHTRGPIGPTNTVDPTTGFYPWDDEWQARQLSYGLVADAMQRFLGVPFNTPLGQKYYNAAQGYSYPSNEPFGGPSTPEMISEYGQRTRPTANPWGAFYPWASG